MNNKTGKIISGKYVIKNCKVKVLIIKFIMTQGNINDLSLSRVLLLSYVLTHY